MRKFWTGALLLALIAIPLIAQTEHNNATEKKASDVIRLTIPVKFGAYTLEPGRYRLACDRKDLKITNVNSEEQVVLPCKGKYLGHRADLTEVHMTVGKDGTGTVDKLLIRGSNIEHTF